MTTALEEHAEASAEKKELTGEAKRRYIGGIFAKVRQAHARGTPEQKKKITAALHALNKQIDEQRKAKEEEEAKRREHPLAGYWHNPSTPERQQLLKAQKEEEKRAKQQEQGRLIQERTEERRAREAYSRLLAKYHNPNLAQERMAALREYEQLQKALRQARHQRFGLKQSQEEQDIKKRMKALDTQYGFTEEWEDQRRIAEAEAAERRRLENIERQKAEAARQQKEQREHEAHMARRAEVLKEREQWQQLSEAEAKRKERELADAWHKVSKELDQLKAAGKTDTPAYDKVAARYDLARLRYQFIDQVVAEKERPAKKAAMEQAYYDEYLAWLKRGKTGNKPKEGYLVDYDEARRIRGQALKAYNQAQKMKR